MKKSDYCFELKKRYEIFLRTKLRYQICFIIVISMIFGLLFFGIVGNEIHDFIEYSKHPIMNWSILGFFFFLINHLLILEALKDRLALKNASLHDELTGVYSRAYIEEATKNAVARARRNGEFFALFIVDVDNFKRINDELGHYTGDKVLCYIASALKKVTHREDDAVIRSGQKGDEFFLIVSLKDPIRMLALIRACIPIDNGYNVSISIGVSFEEILRDTAVHSNSELDELFKRHYNIADAMMYKEKESKKPKREGW